MITLTGFATLAGVVVATQLPGWAAAALLHPYRRPVTASPPLSFEEVEYATADATLRGWRFAAPERRGTIVYLHGIADNRESGIGVAQRFVPRGYDVIAYDSRGHGESDGTICTYGYYEKRDLAAVVATIPGPIILMGSSLGAAVAIQAAADIDNLAGVVAAESFADLRSVAVERAPFFLSAATIDAAFRLAEQRGRFRIDDVSAVSAARRIRAPVFLVHGAADRETSPEHALRVYRALSGPKTLRLVEGAGHNRSLTGAVWREIEAWVVVKMPTGGTSGLRPWSAP